MINIVINTDLTSMGSILILSGIKHYMTQEKNSKDHIIEQAQMIEPQSLSNRFKTASSDNDTQHLVQALNEMLDRVENGYTALKQFTWDAAHQLRTPLAVLSARLSSTNTALEVEDVARDLEWMSRLVGQLLLAAKAGNIEPNLNGQFDLNRMASDVVSGLAPLAVYRGRDIELISEPNELLVKGNSELASEALSNLVENALAHTPIATTVSVITKQPNSISVADHGLGIPKAEQTKIFQRFGQGSRPTTGGAGLGLSIVSEIMRKHKGKVEYADRDGGGAIFSLIFHS